MSRSPEDERYYNNLQAEQYHNKGLTLHSQGNLIKATQMIEKAIQLNPDHDIYYSNLAICFRHQQQYRKAKVNYEKAITLNPKHPEHHYKLGVVLCDLNQHIEALPHIKKAISLIEEAFPNTEAAIIFTSNYVLYHIDLGRVLLNLHMPQEALKYLQKAVKLDCNESVNHYYLGNAHYALGNKNEALKCYQIALELDPEQQIYILAQSSYYVDLALCFAKEKKYEEAKVNYEKAIELDPENAQYYYEISSILCNLSKFSDALEYAEIACQLEPDNIKYIENIASVKNLYNQSCNNIVDTKINHTTITKEQKNKDKGLGYLALFQQDNIQKDTKDEIDQNSMSKKNLIKWCVKNVVEYLSQVCEHALLDKFLLGANDFVKHLNNKSDEIDPKCSSQELVEWCVTNTQDYLFDKCECELLLLLNANDLAKYLHKVLVAQWCVKNVVEYLSQVCEHALLGKFLLCKDDFVKHLNNKSDEIDQKCSSQELVEWCVTNTQDYLFDKCECELLFLLNANDLAKYLHKILVAQWCVKNVVEYLSQVCEHALLDKFLLGANDFAKHLNNKSDEIDQKSSSQELVEWCVTNTQDYLFDKCECELFFLLNANDFTKYLIENSSYTSTINILSADSNVLVDTDIEDSVHSSKLIIYPAVVGILGDNSNSDYETY